jgi:ABC-type branched-subunit amino acid transport system substrate-binding protein
MQNRLLLFIFVISAPFLPANALPAEKKIQIGALTELTGPGAMNGTACLNGYRIADELFRERNPLLAAKIEILYGDHERKQKTAISEFRRLSSAGVWGVACNHSLVGVSINPVSKQTGIPLFGVMGHESFVRDNPFAVRVIPTPDEEGGGLAQKAYENGARTAAILLLEDDYILAVGAAFEKRFIQLGGKIVFKDSLDEGLSDFLPIASRIRSANPDVIEMTLGFQQFGPAIKRLREQGIRQPLYSNYWLAYPEVIEAAGAKNLEGSVFITEKSDFPRFLKTYERLAPGAFRSGVVYRCYTALSVALALLSEHSEIRTQTEYADLARKIESVSLPDGKFELPGREARFELELYEIRNGQSKLLRPAPRAG